MQRLRNAGATCEEFPWDSFRIAEPCAGHLAGVRDALVGFGLRVDPANVFDSSEGLGDLAKHIYGEGFETKVKLGKVRPLGSLCILSNAAFSKSVKIEPTDQTFFRK